MENRRKVEIFGSKENELKVGPTGEFGYFVQYGISSTYPGVAHTSAIVEMEDGTIKNLPLSHIKFVKEGN